MNGTIRESWKTKQSDALRGGTADRVERQIKSGKKTARQRIALLVDKDSFEEVDQLVVSSILDQKIATDGVVTGFATVDGVRIALYSQDFSIKGGSLGKSHAQKICKIMDLAAKIGCPIIGIIDSGGARIDEGIHALGGYGEIFMRNVRYSGVIPQLSVILGPCAGGAVYSPALTDFIFATEKISQLFITGPQVVRDVLHQDISKEELGGASVHAEKSGVVHFLSKTEDESMAQVKKLLSFLPKNYLSSPPQKDLVLQKDGHFLPATVETLLPEKDHVAYDIKAVIQSIVDKNSFFVY